MDESQLQSVRRFNRLVTQRIGALEVDYLRQGRPLAEARLIFEIGADGADVRALRCKLGLDSGYLSRLLQSLKTQGLIAVTKGDDDGRRRHLSLTHKGNAERAAYDRLSDNLVESMLALLDASERARLVAAMGEVERLIRAASVKVAAESSDTADARLCLGTYFREFRGGPGLLRRPDRKISGVRPRSCGHAASIQDEKSSHRRISRGATRGKPGVQLL